MIDLSFHKINNKNDPSKSYTGSNDNKGHVVSQQSTKMKLTITLDQTTKLVTVNMDLPKNISFTYDSKNELIQSVISIYFKHLPLHKQYQGVTITCFTELFLSNKIYQCHPNYRGSGPWNDYILLNHEYRNTDFDSNRLQEKSYSIPGKLIGFIQISEIAPIQAIVHVCHDLSVEETVLTLRWKLNFVGDTFLRDDFETPYTENLGVTNSTPLFQLVDLDQIMGHTLIIPYDLSSKFVIQVKDYNSWANLFLE